MESTAAAGGEEGIGILEIAVALGDTAGDLTFGQRRTVEGGDDSDHIFADLGHFRERDFKQEGVDPIGAGGEEGRLSALLPAGAQEHFRILKHLTIDPAGEHRTG